MVDVQSDYTAESCLVLPDDTVGKRPAKLSTDISEVMVQKTQKQAKPLKALPPPPPSPRNFNPSSLASTNLGGC